MCECLAADHTECPAVDEELDKNYGEWFDQWTE
jgi:hypothetical protein